ncbi:hypothetical protein [Lichenicoccus sp.]|uniref:hypothetical protein n=1 Tax=Lichenicoccus sp. TaxID=2781899 RepID=UPI003D0A39C4
MARNTSQKQNSLRIQSSPNKFYPDFVVELQDGRILVVEYKGDRAELPEKPATDRFGVNTLLPAEAVRRVARRQETRPTCAVAEKDAARRTASYFAERRGRADWEAFDRLMQRPLRETSCRRTDGLAAIATIVTPTA